MDIFRRATMANAFDQFDVNNPFDQFDSGNISPSNGKVSSLASESPQVVSPLSESQSQEKTQEDLRREQLLDSIQNMKSRDGTPVKGTGMEYLIEDMTEKLNSNDPILSLDHNLTNPHIQGMEDTPEYILRGLPEDVAKELYDKHSKPGYNWLTGEKTVNFRPSRMVKKAAEFERYRAKDPGRAEVIENLGPNEAFMVGMGEGFYSVGEGVGLLEDRDPEQREMDKALRARQEGAGVGKFTGQALPFLVPGGAISNIASTPVRIGAMGGLGATEGNIIARGEGGDTNQIIKATGLGFLIGTLGEAALPAVNSLGRKYVRHLKKGNVSDDILNKISVGPDGTPSPEFKKILDENGVEFGDFARGAAEGFDDPVMNAQRKKIFDDMGLDITEAQRTRNADLFNMQQDALRREGPIKTALERQEEILDQRMKGEIGGIGGVSQRANSSPIEAIMDKATQLDDEISDLYKLAREQAPEDKVIKFNKAIENLRSNAPQDQMSNGTVRALNMKMRDMGVMNDEWKAIGKVDLNTSEELRKFANRIYGNANPEGRQIIREFKNALDDDVFKSMDKFSKTAGNKKIQPISLDDSDLHFQRKVEDELVNLDTYFETDNLDINELFPEAEDLLDEVGDKLGIDWRSKFDLKIDPGDEELEAVFYLSPKQSEITSTQTVDYFKKARAAKYSFEKGLDPSTLNKFDKSKTSLVRDILTTTVEEDDLVRRVLSRGSKYKARHLSELKNYLTTGTEGQVAQGLRAWNDIRAAAMQQIKDEAFTGPLTRTGTQTLSRAKLENAIKKIGPAKMEVLFSSKERDFLKKLMAVATLKEPPPGTFMGSGPSSPAIKELTDVVKRRIPVLGDIYEGVVEKIQNRATDRKILELIDDAKIIASQNEKLSFQKLRRSKAGTMTATIPPAVIISSAADEKEEGDK